MLSFKIWIKLYKCFMGDLYDFLLDSTPIRKKIHMKNVFKAGKALQTFFCKRLKYRKS